MEPYPLELFEAKQPEQLNPDVPHFYQKYSSQLSPLQPGHQLYFLVR